jgi:hypothetical protein
MKTFNVQVQLCGRTNTNHAGTKKTVIGAIDVRSALEPTSTATLCFGLKVTFQVASILKG